MWGRRSSLGEAGKRERIPPPLAFCSIPALDGLVIHGHFREDLLSPLIQMLISSGNNVTDIPRNNI